MTETTSAATTHASLTSSLAKLMKSAAVDAGVIRSCRWFTGIPLLRKLPMVVICGQISSGKSSLMNALLGDDILPVSAIPLSHVPVFVSYGEPAAIAHMDDGSMQTLDGAGLYQAATGKLPDLSYVTISLPSPFLKSGMIIVDAPPWDHPSPAVRKTVAFLQEQADLAVLLLEYELVHAEGNRRALHSLLKSGTPVIPVVTQMDRHDERYPLAEFTSGAVSHIEETGGDRSLVRFVSVREMKGIDDLQALIQGKLPPLLEGLSGRRDLQRKRLRAALEQELGIAELRQIEQAEERAAQKVEKLRERLGRLRELPMIAAGHLMAVAEKSLEGPFSTDHLRPLAHHLAEACSPTFRAGLLNRESMRRQERQHRLTLVLDELQQVVEKDICWRIRTDTVREGQKLYPLGTAGIKALSSVAPSVSSDDVMKLAYRYESRSDAPESFTAALMTLVKESVRERLRNLIASIEGDAKEFLKTALPEAQRELSAAETEYSAMQVEIARFQEKLDMLRQVDTLLDSLLKAAPQYLPEQGNGHLSRYMPPEDSDEGLPTQEEQSSTTMTIAEFNELRCRLLEALEKAVFLIERQSEGKDADRIRRCIGTIKGEVFTIFIVGLAGADRGSLANVFTGRQFLSGMDSEIPPARVVADETGEKARIFLKGAEEVKLEMEAALAALGRAEETLVLEKAPETLPPVLASLKQAGHPGRRGELSFLLAAAQGLREVLPMLGKEIELPRARLHNLPAHLWHFVREITVAGPSDFLAQGVALTVIDDADLENGAFPSSVASADAVIVLLPLHHVTGAGAERLLSDVARIGSGKVPVFFVIDGADPSSGKPREIHEAEKQVRENLEKLGDRASSVFLISADLYLMASALRQGTYDLQLLQRYRRKACRDRDAHVPDPAANLEASGIPALMAALEHASSTKKGIEVVRQGCNAAIPLLEGLAAASGTALMLMLNDKDQLHGASRRFELVCGEARLELAALKEELNGSIEHALRKSAEERRNLLNGSRKTLDRTVDHLLSELFSSMDPRDYAGASLPRELSKRAAQLSEELCSAFSFEQHLTSLQSSNSFNRRAERIERTAAARFASIKARVFAIVTGESVPFTPLPPGIAATFKPQRFISAEFGPAELAREMRKELFFLNEPEKIAGSIRTVMAKKAESELSSLFVALDLDLSDLMEARMGEFLQRLTIHLEKELECHLRRLAQAFAEAAAVFAADGENAGRLMEAAEQKRDDVSAQLRHLQELYASIVEAAEKAMQQ